MSPYAAGLLWAALLGLLAAGARGAVVRRGRTRRRRLLAAPASPDGHSDGSPDRPPAPRPGSRIAAALRARRTPRWAVPELLLVPAGLLGGWSLGSPVPALAALAAVHPLYRWRLGRQGRRAEWLREAAVVELCTALAAELRTGAVPGQALESAVAPGGPTAEALHRGGVDTTALLAAARFAGDVPAALRRTARLRGAAGAAAVAACWQVASDSGAGLAAALDRVAEALRADCALRETVRGELAGPRTTALLLAVLPLFGLLLGSALGAEPLRMLLHTPAGLGCLAAGVALEAAGLAWTARIVRGAEGVGACAC
ncbi:type II secretion system F family protein [Peterkaempfera bronchialis]|uniref:type II secretion system F family protein n=1 Tax=Peterkaempfera bronchialis TaxID=2126346 RepID=UPI001E570CFA|nr:type II secretion system F family protein [Peterkaempfera bronchialis]